jgi:hypothetical protein
MSNVNKFSSPADLQAKFNAAMSALIALGEQAGCSYTAGGELSDSELGAVAGGMGYGSGSGSGSSSGSSGGRGSGPSSFSSAQNYGGHHTKGQK